MKKHIALGIAAAVLGASGVASAIVSVDQLTSATASDSSISAATDSLAANCWIITGGAQDAGCDTSVAGLELPGLPGVPTLPEVPGVDLDMLTGLLGTATGAVDGLAIPNPASLAGDAQGLIGGAVPSACGLPVGLPVPAGIFTGGLNLFNSLQHLAMSQAGAAALPALPVSLPVSAPTADDALNTVQTETKCLADSATGLPVDVPAVCNVSGGVPSAVTSALPGPVSGLLGTIGQTIAEISGQAVNVAGSSNLGVNCNLDSATAALPAVPDVTSVVPSLPALPNPTSVIPALPAAPSVPSLPAVPAIPSVPGLPTVPSIPAVGDTVTSVVDTVTGLVGSVTGGELPVAVPSLPLPTSTPSCSASGSTSVLGGLLGSLTASISGGCN